jgi:predicted esterase
MTRADRLAELEDQATYLTALLERLSAGCPADVRVTVLGFSQGTATVSRWLARGAARWRPQQLVLWAGDFPADIELMAAQQLLLGLPVTLVLRQHGADVTTLIFAGGHTMNSELLRQLHAAQLA